MSEHELAHLTLLAEVDTLLAELQTWAERAPDWSPARSCQALIRRLASRADTLKVRLEAPLVIATLGGTGTGKSTLINALAGDDVTDAGRQRPTTRQPILICRPGITPELLGISPATVHVVHRELPALRDVVLVDCPDPDTTEEVQAGAGTNLARLREILPHCDVLLVASTQQKYRSSRVLDELAAAAAGVHLVFVQTHADVDPDIREDWRTVLEANQEPRLQGQPSGAPGEPGRLLGRSSGEHYATGEMFYVDSVSALADAQRNIQPHGEFARLVDLLTRQLAGAAGHRIRRANFLDLCRATLAACRELVERDQATLAQVDAAIIEQRTKLAQRLAERMRDELAGCRRQWEGRLVGEVASRWGFSPFALVLRAYQGLGALATSAALLRARTPAQLALWGAIEGGRRFQLRRKNKQADRSVTRASAWSFDAADLRTAAIIMDGYAAEAGLKRDEARPDHILRQADLATQGFMASAAGQVQSLVARLANRHTGWFTRLRYEALLVAMLALLLFRLGWNFFYSSWWAPQPEPLYDLKIFVHALFWFFLWCVVLLWFFTGRLRRGLKSEITRLSEQWSTPATTGALFAGLEGQCRAIRQYAAELGRLDQDVAGIQRRLETPEPRLGHRVG